MPTRRERGQRHDRFSVNVLIEDQPKLAVGSGPVSSRIAYDEPGRGRAETEPNLLRESCAAHCTGPGWNHDPILRCHRHALTVRREDQGPRVHPPPLTERLRVKPRGWIRNYAGINAVQGDHRRGERDRHTSSNVNLALRLVPHHLQRGRHAYRCGGRTLRVAIWAGGWWKRNFDYATGPRARQ
jgi:hypothetical protein